MTYLTPFLALLKASDVSGPITGTVAVALQRILASDLICESARTGGQEGGRGGSSGSCLKPHGARAPPCTRCSARHAQRRGGHQPGGGGHDAGQV